MGLLFVLVKTSDSTCLCLLRAKIKGCSFLRNILFLWIVLFSFVLQLPDIYFKLKLTDFWVDSHLGYTETCNWWPLPLPQRTRCLGLGLDWLTVSQILASSFFLFTASYHSMFPLIPSLILLFNIPHQAHSETSVCKRLAFDFVFYSRTNKALCIWGIWTAFLGKKRLFLKRILLLA